MRWSFNICIHYLAALLFSTASLNLNAQTPTVQDCLGAIPICQNVYSTTVSYSGEGNSPNEINSNTSCLGSGELNDVWYTFTVQQSGNLNFTITPNNLNDDYDWAVYNLTNANCSQIFTNPALEVSCNFSATPGNTGPTGTTAFTSQPASGVPFNNVIPVTAGQTYVVNVSNFSSTQFGYTINFGASTAVIFDQIPPQLVSVNNPGCGATQLTVTFSENILCNTVQATDFSISGPGGPYTVTGVSSPVCTAGGTYTNAYTITISPAIINSGNFTANLIGPVTDLCGNVAIFPAQQNFVIGSFTYTSVVTPSNCAANNGSVVLTISGAGPFTYTWSPNVSSTSTASNLAPANYSVTILDQGTGCTSTASFTIIQTNNLVATPSIDDTICPGASATISLNVPFGISPITYTWSNGLPNQSSHSVSPATTTTYNVSVVDGQGCTAGPFPISIVVAGAVTVTASATSSTVCAGNPVTLNAVGSGGYGTITYVWQPGNITGNSVTVNPTNTTTYTVTATDICSLSGTDQVTIQTIPLPLVSFTADTLSGCTPLYVQFTLDTGAYPPGTTYFWDFDDGGPTSTVSNPAHTFLTPGCHDVALTVTIPPGCSKTQTYPCMIRTIAQPNAAFTASPTITSILDATIQFTNQSTGATSWTWDFDDNTGSVEWSPSHTYLKYDLFDVMLIVVNDSGCVDTAFLRIEVRDYHTFYVPNAFTPDEDGLNESWAPVHINILSQGFQLIVFDRWGKQVFATTDKDAQWNGRFQNTGDPVQQDVYAYRVIYYDNFNQKHEEIGSVTVIR